jgi:hypothetical protein
MLQQQNAVKANHLRARSFSPSDPHHAPEVMSALHSRSGSGSPSYFDLLEQGSVATAGHGLKLRPRASSNDLVHLASSPMGADER